MGHSKWDIPPNKDDLLFNDFILDLFHHVFGLGADVTGILDDDNLLPTYLRLDEDYTVTGDWTIEGAWTFSTHPLGLDHGQIGGLSDDDHTQYALLAGRSGGQTLIGGTDANDDLLFQSTSNGTLGHIAFTSLQNGLIWDGEKKALAIGGSEHSMTVGGVTKDHSFTTHSTGGSNAYDIVFHRHSATSGSFLAGARSRGSESSPSIVQDGDGLLCLFGIGYDGTDHEFATAIEFQIDGTPDAGDMPGRIVFLTTPEGSDTLVERMRITQEGQVVLSKASGKGIQIDLSANTFGWRDTLGDIFARNTGASKPTFTTYRGTLLDYQFAVGDEEYLKFHIPHDYVAGTDIFLHIHWSHTGTLVTGGTVTFEVESSYSKGHNQEAFSAPATGTYNGAASTIQYQQIISETQYSASSPTGLQIDTDDLEPDGVILVRTGLNSNDITVSGGGVPDPFIHYVDIHYRSSNIATKDKAPDFYA